MAMATTSGGGGGSGSSRSMALPMPHSSPLRPNNNINIQQQQQGTFLQSQPLFNHSFNHSVCRSEELLSCAKTALKMAKRQHKQQHSSTHSPAADEKEEWWSTLSVEDLSLHKLEDYNNNLNQIDHSDNNASIVVVEEAMDLLRGMHVQLDTLEQLVRRRGHTNDPTEEIQLVTQRLQADTQELLQTIPLLTPSSTNHHPKGIFKNSSSSAQQYQKHWQIVTLWFQGAAQEQGQRLQEILKTRGTVLAEQAQRRKLFTNATTSTSSNATTANPATSASMSSSAALLSSKDNPLFSIKAPKKNMKQNININNNATTTTMYSTSAPHSFPLTQQQAQQNGSSSTAFASTTTNNNSNNNNAFISSSSTSSIGMTAPSSYPNVSSAKNHGFTNGSTNPTPNSAATTTTIARKPIPSVPVTAGYGGGYYYYNNNSSNNNPNSGGFTSSSSSSLSTTTGMRQRRAVVASAMSQDSSSQQQQQQHQPQDYHQTQLLIRQQERQSQQRLHEARQAEKSLAELGTMFGKMSTLISHQSEIISKVEDDVEAAFGDVQAGAGEIQTLYTIKKGNRPLILKVFALLIFFIVFMRFYK